MSIAPVIGNHRKDGRVSEISPLKKALQAWAERHSITPAVLAQDLGYTYNHAFQILRGSSKVSDETMGKLTLTYGAEAAAEILGLAEQYKPKESDQ